jgi:DNA-binding Lrp family transcriptional regulator
MQVMALSEKELQLVHALQIWPRAPWSQLASSLAADPVTLARRWSEVSGRGSAWITCQPNQKAFRHGAVVEVDCISGSVNSVVASVSSDPSCISIEVVSGGRSLMLTVNCATATDLTRYLVSRLGEMPGVHSVRANPVITTIVAGEQWRLNVLAAEQIAAVESARQAVRAHTDVSRSLNTDDSRALIDILCRDGRATSTMIGQSLGIPQRRARECVHTALGSGLIELRTDVLRRESGWPVSAWYFLRVPAANLREVGTRLRTLRSVRTVLSVAGPANVLVQVWLRSMSEVEGLEIAMQKALPSIRIADRSVVLAVRKRIGRTFDEDELPQGVVPWEPLAGEEVLQ